VGLVELGVANTERFRCETWSGVVTTAACEPPAKDGSTRSSGGISPTSLSAERWPGVNPAGGKVVENRWTTGKNHKYIR